MGDDIVAGSATKSAVAGGPKHMLRHINALPTAADLLEYVGERHADLDTINLATVLYRLARLYGFRKAEDEKAQWMAELTSSPHFKLLLECLHLSLLDAQQLLLQRGETHGLNAWCVSNILWSLAKLKSLQAKALDVASLSAELAVAVGPLVQHYLPGFSEQGLGNVLWSYAQISDAPVSVMVAVLNHVISLLGSDQAHMMDAHAVARTLWSVSMVRTAGHPADSDAEWQQAATQVLLAAAHHALEALTSGSWTSATQAPARSDRGLFQAMSTIAYSYSVLLGSGCAVQDPIRSLFDVIQQKLAHRLHMVLGSPAPARPGPNNALNSFNGHILSTLVKAYDTAQLLTSDLLQLVLDVAAVKISQNKPVAQGVKFFKSEELCDLLHASATLPTNPLGLVHALSDATRVMGIPVWTPAELTSIQAAVAHVQEHTQQHHSGLRTSQAFCEHHTSASTKPEHHTAPLPVPSRSLGRQSPSLYRTHSLDVATLRGTAATATSGDSTIQLLQAGLSHQAPAQQLMPCYYSTPQQSGMRGTSMPGHALHARPAAAVATPGSWPIPTLPTPAVATLQGYPDQGSALLSRGHMQSGHGMPGMLQRDGMPLPAGTRHSLLLSQQRSLEQVMGHHYTGNDFLDGDPGAPLQVLDWPLTQQQVVVPQPRIRTHIPSLSPAALGPSSAPREDSNLADLVHLLASLRTSADAPNTSALLRSPLPASEGTHGAWGRSAASPHGLPQTSAQPGGRASYVAPAIGSSAISTLLSVQSGPAILSPEMNGATSNSYPWLNTNGTDHPIPSVPTCMRIQYFSGFPMLPPWPGQQH